MSKKPVPSKKQAVSSTRSRYGAYVRKMRVKLEKKTVVQKCPQCGEPKRFHFACPSCGYYRGRPVLQPKQKKSAEPIREIKA